MMRFHSIEIDDILHEESGIFSKDEKYLYVEFDEDGKALNYLNSKMDQAEKLKIIKLYKSEGSYNLFSVSLITNIRSKEVKIRID